MAQSQTFVLSFQLPDGKTLTQQAPTDAYLWDILATYQAKFRVNLLNKTNNNEEWLVPSGTFGNVKVEFFLFCQYPCTACCTLLNQNCILKPWLLFYIWFLCLNCFIIDLNGTKTSYPQLQNGIKQQNNWDLSIRMHLL